MNTEDTAKRWYSVTAYGAATLCVDEGDARAVASDSDRMWPNAGPHTVAQLVDSAPMLAEIERLRANVAEFDSVFGHLGMSPDDAGNEIVALRTERDALRARLEAIECGEQPAVSATAGMTLRHRIGHVGGTVGDDGRITFFSAMAVMALIVHYARDTRPASSTAVPDGFVLVPRRITREMADAWADDDGDVQTAWTALIAAADARLLTIKSRSPEIPDDSFDWRVPC